MTQIALFQKFFALKTWIVLIIIFLIYTIALTIELRLVFTDNLYFNSFEGKRTAEGIHSFISAERKIEWLNYPMAGLVVLVSALLISFCLNVGAILNDYKVSFVRTFGIALKAQIIFAINYLTSNVIRALGLIEFSYSTANNNFEYQSALVFFDKRVLPEWLLYPIQCINIAETVHILFLTMGVSWLLNMRYSKGLFFVLLWYGMGLVFWIVFTVFLQVTFYN